MIRRLIGSELPFGLRARSDPLNGPIPGWLPQYLGFLSHISNLQLAFGSSLGFLASNHEADCRYSA